MKYTINWSPSNFLRFLKETQIYLSLYVNLYLDQWNSMYSATVLCIHAHPSISYLYKDRLLWILDFKAALCTGASGITKMQTQEHFPWNHAKPREITLNIGFQGCTAHRSIRYYVLKRKLTKDLQNFFKLLILNSTASRVCKFPVICQNRQFRKSDFKKFPGIP